MGPDMENKIRNILFDGSNFNNWKFRVETLLDERDLLVFIEQSLDVILRPHIESPAKVAELRKFEKQCKSLLIQCIADSHLEYVKDKKTAKDVFDVLVRTFERKVFRDSFSCGKGC